MVAWPAGGDYSSMSIDPADDCTFWYTNEYAATDGFAGNAACYGLVLGPCPDTKTEFSRRALGASARARMRDSCSRWVAQGLPRAASGGGSRGGT